MHALPSRLAGGSVLAVALITGTAGVFASLATWMTFDAGSSAHGQKPSSAVEPIEATGLDAPHSGAADPRSNDNPCTGPGEWWDDSDDPIEPNPSTCSSTIPLIASAPSRAPQFYESRGELFARIQLEGGEAILRSSRDGYCMLVPPGPTLEVWVTHDWVIYTSARHTEGAVIDRRPPARAESGACSSESMLHYKVWTYFVRDHELWRRPRMGGTAQRLVGRTRGAVNLADDAVLDASQRWYVAIRDRSGTTRTR